MKFLISFFVFRYLFPSCFLTKETPEKLANVFSSDFKNQFFHHYKTFDLDTWRNELNLQKQIKNIHKIWKDIMFIKKNHWEEQRRLWIKKKRIRKHDQKKWLIFQFQSQECLSNISSGDYKDQNKKSLAFEEVDMSMQEKT